jgi:hypothetical protein
VPSLKGVQVVKTEVRQIQRIVCVENVKVVRDESKGQAGLDRLST